MAGVLHAVASRTKFLAVCYKANMDRDATRKLAEQCKTLILKLVSDYPRELSLDAAGALIRCISEDLELFSSECRHELIDCINSKTSRNDIQPSDNIVGQQAVAERAHTSHRKQQLYYIENYFPNSIWRRLISVHVNREMVYLDIAKLLIKLGFTRPEEKFWAHLVGFIQWATEVPMENPYNDRDILKQAWKEAKCSAPWPCAAPIVYPKYPSELMDRYPGIYMRTYVGADVPVRPPLSKNAKLHSLNILKSTTPCRNTKGNSFADLHPEMMLQRYHLVLETMLVFGKLRPQRLRGQLY